MIETIFQPGSYTVLMPFCPVSGGRGVAVAATASASAAAALPTTTGIAQTVMATNDSNVAWWILFGSSGIAATLADLPILPGTQVVYTMPNDGTYTHYSVITRAGAGFGTLNFGLGT